MQPATQTRRKKLTTPADSMRSRVIEAVESDERVRAAKADLSRLESKRAEIHNEFDRLLSGSKNIEAMADRFEADDEITLEATRSNLDALRDQVTAADLAVNRARGRLETTLREVAADITPPFEAEHAERVAEMAKCLLRIDELIEQLPEIPTAMKAAGLGSNPTKFPTWLMDDLLRLRPRLRYFAETYSKSATSTEAN